MRILLIEDNDDDAYLIREALSDATTVTVQLEWLDRLERGLTRLSQGHIDAVLLDLSLSDSQGLATFDTVHAHAPEVPIVVLTGMNDEVTAIEAVQRGAQDYLAKKQLDSDRLVRALRYAMERHRVERQLGQSTERLESSGEPRSGVKPVSSASPRKPPLPVTLPSGVDAARRPGRGERIGERDSRPLRSCPVVTVTR